MRVEPVDLAGVGGGTGAAVSQSVVGSPDSSASDPADAGGDYAGRDGGRGCGRAGKRPDHQPQRCGTGPAAAGAGVATEQHEPYRGRGTAEEYAARHDRSAVADLAGQGDGAEPGC